MRGSAVATVDIVVAGTKADANLLFRDTSDNSMDNRSTRNVFIVVLILIPAVVFDQSTRMDDYVMLSSDCCVDQAIVQV